MPERYLRSQICDIPVFIFSNLRFIDNKPYYMKGY